MSDTIREIIYPTFVVVLIASVWAIGWDKSHSNSTDGSYAPRVSHSDWIGTDSDDVGDPSTNGGRVGGGEVGAEPVTSTLSPGD